MRIGIDVRPLQFDSSFRGTGNYIRTLLKELSPYADDVEFHLIHVASRPVPSDLSTLIPKAKPLALNYPTTYEEALPRGLRDPRLRHLPFLPGRLWRRYWHNHLASLASLADKAKLDVMHMTAPFDPQIGPCPKFSCGSVATFLDAIPVLFPTHYYDLWHINYRKLYDLQRETFKGMDKIVAISDSSRDDAVRLFDIPKERAATIYCGNDKSFDCQFDQAEIAECLHRLRLRQPFFLFCSVLDWHKNMQRIVPALRTVQDKVGKPVQLAIVGPQTDSGKALLREYAFDAGLTGKDIVIAGYVSSRDLRILFNATTALVSPSLYEGFGLPLLNAMQAGTAVIAANRSSQPEVVGDAGILVDPESIDEIAAAMLEVMDNSSRREEMIRKGKEQIKKFSLEEQAAAYMDAYRSVAK